MISRVLINVDNKDYIDDYRKVGVTAFLFALEDFSVGYNTFSLEEINNIEVSNKYVLINRILDSSDVDKLKMLLKDMKFVKGIVYEDIALYMIIRELNLDFEMIFFQNHFATNVNSVNFWLDRVDSIFLSNEITKEELIKITREAKKKVCLHLFGYNQVMYSRRLLLSNYAEEFELPIRSSSVITDKATKVKFRAVENKYGTVMYSEKIFNGKDLLGIDNVYYFYVNPTMIDHNRVMEFLISDTNYDDEDNGFLNKETIYKLKEVPKK